MANTHTVTVFIWKNSHANDVAADNGQKLAGDSAETGHAAMKLQTVGAAKGDYYYLSFWPGYHPQNKMQKFHSMSARYGPKSLAAANTTMSVDWGHIVAKNPQLMTTKKFPTSLDWAGHFAELAPGMPGLGGDDVTAMGRKPDIKYRMNGLALQPMIDYARRISAYYGEGATGKTFNIRDFNCATAVARCLKAGGAPGKPNRDVWSPNRLAGWCEVLIGTYGGVKVGG